MNCFTTSNPKSVITTLRTVAIEKPKLAFLLVFQFHEIINGFCCVLAAYN